MHEMRHSPLSSFQEDMSMGHATSESEEPGEPGNDTDKLIYGLNLLRLALEPTVTSCFSRIRSLFFKVPVYCLGCTRAW